MKTISNPLQYHLECEDYSEDNVENLQHISKLLRLFVVLHRHGDHVSKDDRDNNYLKLGAAGQFEEKLLDFVLKNYS